MALMNSSPGNATASLQRRTTVLQRIRGAGCAYYNTSP
jgi:hypothetical protein